MSISDHSLFLSFLWQLQELQAVPEIRIAFIICLICTVFFFLVTNHRQKNQLRQSLATTEEKLAAAGKKIDTLDSTVTKYQISRAQLATLLRTERKNSVEKLALLEDAREDLRLQFAALAQQIFEEKHEKFSSQSKEKLEAILQPFHLQVDSLKKEINDIYLNDTRERATLKKEILDLRQLNQQINQEAINLTRALKGDTRIQGNWGELVLERVLEQSGLRQGHEYEVQKGYRDKENKLFKPDVILRLPEGKDIIIDSKVSLVSWEKYCSCEDEQHKSRHLNGLVRAVREHISSLGSKNYAELKGVHSLDFVLMFMPVEAAFMTAFQHDEKLFTDAFASNIVVVTPTTLLATLRTIENIWRYEHQSRNSLEIARRAGLMYDKFRGFVDDMEKIGKQLDTCHLTYESAMAKLTKGRGNLVSQASQLTELGVQAKKELPKSVTDICDQGLRN